MLRDILLHSGEVLHEEGAVGDDKAKQSSSSRVMQSCCDTVKPFAKRLKDHDL